MYRSCGRGFELIQRETSLFGYPKIFGQETLGFSLLTHFPGNEELLL